MSGGNVIASPPGMPGRGVTDVLLGVATGAAAGAFGRGSSSEPPTPTGRGRAGLTPRGASPVGLTAFSSTPSAGIGAPPRLPGGLDSVVLTPAGPAKSDFNLGFAFTHCVYRSESSNASGGGKLADVNIRKNVAAASTLKTLRLAALAARARDARPDKGVISVARDGFVQPRLEINQLLALCARSEVDGERKGRQLQHLLQGIEGSGERTAERARGAEAAPPILASRHPGRAGTRPLTIRAAAPSPRRSPPLLRRASAMPPATTVAQPAMAWQRVR
eukprot:scaffold145112_cov30-Tisochrysis_lutea.AAC.1